MGGISCSTGKICFETFAEAKSVVNNANRTRTHHYSSGKRVNRGASKKPKRVYECEECGCYHLTSQNKVKTKQRI